MEVLNVQDAKRIYLNSLIRIQDVPVFVKAISEDMKLHVISLEDKKRLVIPVNSKQINDKPVPTGFVNGYGTSVYVCRSTPRVYQQGLSNENMKVHHLNASDWDRTLRDEVYSLLSPNLVKCIRGDYPTLEEAIQSCKDGATICAFGRNKAITNKGIVYYKTEAVGKFTRGAIVLGDGYKHYNWVFEEKCV